MANAAAGNERTAAQVADDLRHRLALAVAGIREAHSQATSLRDSLGKLKLEAKDHATLLALGVLEQRANAAVEALGKVYSIDRS